MKKNKYIIIFLIVINLTACKTTIITFNDLSYKVGNIDNNDSTFTIVMTTPHKSRIKEGRKGFYGAIERPLFRIDSLEVYHNAELLWKIQNQDKLCKAFHIRYGQIPITYIQLFPIDNKKPKKLEKGIYKVQYYFDNKHKECLIEIKNN